jgi:biopolymer transport protein TolR
VKVDLPEASAEPMPPEEQEPLVVNVDAAGNLYLNIADDPNKPVSGDDLRQRVAAVLRRSQNRSVLVRGDHAAEYGSVVAAMVLLQQAGAPSVGLVTEPPEGE